MKIHIKILYLLFKTLYIKYKIINQNLDFWKNNPEVLMIHLDSKNVL